MAAVRFGSQRALCGDARIGRPHIARWINQLAIEWRRTTPQLNAERNPGRHRRVVLAVVEQKF
jgi:hypothetical protein